ncbi:uncharacterized protein [Argopecten irradians]|uniref:uncharacterized protein isoform X2 n=1 Tax=Argopecten irradians TaxID=31199 RepID=UPI003722B10D
MAKYRVLVSVCYLLISVIYASDFIPNISRTDAEKSEHIIKIADEEEGKIRTVKATSTVAPPSVDNRSDRNFPLRKNRSPDFLEDMGEPKSFKDDFAEIFEVEPKKETTFEMETKMMYATELRDRKKGKINDFEIKPLKYKSHKFHLKEGGEVCTLEPLTGPCRSRKRRYFYNIQTEECEEFIYGGCRGNGNNFLSKEECEESCAK